VREKDRARRSDESIRIIICPYGGNARATFFAPAAFRVGRTTSALATVDHSDVRARTVLRIRLVNARKTARAKTKHERKSSITRPPPIVIDGGPDGAYYLFYRQLSADQIFNMHIRITVRERVPRIMVFGRTLGNWLKIRRRKVKLNKRAYSRVTLRSRRVARRV